MFLLHVYTCTTQLTVFPCLCFSYSSQLFVISWLCWSYTTLFVVFWVIYNTVTCTCVPVYFLVIYNTAICDCVPMLLKYNTVTRMSNYCHIKQQFVFVWVFFVDYNTVKYVGCINHSYNMIFCHMISCIFVTFPRGVLGKVWYLIVSIPDLFLLTYFVGHLCNTIRSKCIN